MGNSEVAVGPEDCGHGAQPVSGPLQARPQHAMQFPAELTQNACRTRSRDLRLICIYFSSTRFFQVSPCWWAMKGGCWPLPGGFAGGLGAVFALPPVSESLAQFLSSHWEMV